MKEKELIKRDERLDKIAELGLSGDVDWTVAESAYDRMIKSRYSSMSGALGLPGDIVGAEMGIARGEAGGAGGTVQWTTMQTVKDEFVRNMMGTVNTIAGEVTGRAFGGSIDLGGFAGLGGILTGGQGFSLSNIAKNIHDPQNNKAVLGSLLSGGLGILGSLFQYGMNAAQQANTDEITATEMLRMMGMFKSGGWTS